MPFRTKKKTNILFIIFWVFKILASRSCLGKGDFRQRFPFLHTPKKNHTRLPFSNNPKKERKTFSPFLKMLESIRNSKREFCYWVPETEDKQKINSENPSTAMMKFNCLQVYMGKWEYPNSFSLPCCSLLSVVFEFLSSLMFSVYGLFLFSKMKKAENSSLIVCR